MPFVVGGGERADPAVEELHRGCPRLHLGAQRRQGHVGQRVEEPGEEVGIPPHEGLGMGVDARRPPFDQVTRHRERSPGEPDEGDAEGVELRGDQADGFEHVAGVGLGLEGAQPGQVFGCSEGPIDDRAPALFHLDPEAHRRGRHHDVAEEDRGVDAIAAHGLQGQLRGELGLSDGVEHAPLATRRPVLGQ